MTAGLRAKSALESENSALREEIAELKFNLTGFTDISEENAQLKEILGRVGSREVVLAVVLAKPGQSPYDTLVIDMGSRDGIADGARVFAYGDVLIGNINKVMPKSSIISGGMFTERLVPDFLTVLTKLSFAILLYLIKSDKKRLNLI